MCDPERIHCIHAREVLDSRGNPTVEVEVHCPGGWGRAIVPSGASTGRHEAHALRDGDPHRYGGKGVRKAVNHVVNEIAPALVGVAVTDQSAIDRRLCQLDGTPNKGRLGANAILGVSLASAHAAAAVRQQPLWQYLEGSTPARMPLPMVNMISGGLHAGGNIDVQDYLFLPIAARTYSEALEQTGRVYRALADVLRRHGFESVLVGDEGGFGPHLHSNEQAIELLLDAFTTAGLTPGRDAGIALDIAASHFFDGHHYGWQGKKIDRDAMLTMFERWVDVYPIYSIEDGMAEDDWDGWRQLTQTLGHRVQLVGDDLFVTHPDRLKRGIDNAVANSILIKVNQIGTLTEALAVMEKARAAGYRCVVSARSGETEDSTLADLAVATGAGQIKIGSVARSERLAKYNQLLRIEEQLSAPERFAHWQPVC